MQDRGGKGFWNSWGIMNKKRAINKSEMSMFKGAGPH